MDRFSLIALVAAAVGFVIIALLAVAYIYIWPSNKIFVRPYVLGLGVAVTVLVLVSWLLNIASGLILIWRLGLGFGVRARYEMEHDLGICSEILQYDELSCLKAKSWFLSKARLAKSRSSLGYKVSSVLFFPPVLDFASSSFFGELSLSLNAFSAIFAACWFALIGVLIGSLIQELYAARLRYFAQIIDLTIDQGFADLGQ